MTQAAAITEFSDTFVARVWYGVPGLHSKRPGYRPCMDSTCPGRPTQVFTAFERTIRAAMMMAARRSDGQLTSSGEFHVGKRGHHGRKSPRNSGELASLHISLCFARSASHRNIYQRPSNTEGIPSRRRNTVSLHEIHICMAKEPMCDALRYAVLKYKLTALVG